MIDDTQARELLEAAGGDIAALPLDPAAMMAGSRRARRRRAATVVGAAVSVTLLIWGGLVWAKPYGSGTSSVSQAPQGGSDRPVINTSPSAGGIVMQAITGGVIEVSSQGCLVVEFGGHMFDVRWPYGFTVDARPDGSYVVEDETGRPVASVGGSFSAAGGLPPDSGPRLPGRWREN